MRPRGAATAGAIVDGQSCPAYVDGKAYTPQIPTTIQPLDDVRDGTQVAYFTAPSTQAGGPTFRVRASTLPNGDVLIVAQPLGDIESTLHHLLLIELIVTGAP